MTQMDWQKLKVELGTSKANDMHAVLYRRSQSILRGLRARLLGSELLLCRLPYKFAGRSVTWSGQWTSGSFPKSGGPNIEPKVVRL